jgi:hypothetical protein
MSHYTYMLKVKEPTDARALYIGVRTCKAQPELDSAYLGSCKPLKAWVKDNGADKVEKIILGRWPTREEAMLHEILLHDCFDVGRNQEFWNRAKQRSEMFDTTGVSPWSKGIKLSPERAAFMRQLAIGNQHRKGSKQSPEAIEKNRLAHIGKSYHNTPHTEESKMKVSIAKKGQRSSPATEFKPGFTPWNKGVSPSEETRKKISMSLKLRSQKRNENV